MRTPEDRTNAVPACNPSIHYVNDFERCETIDQLSSVMESINRNQYQLISVTQDTFDVYTVFFRRYLIG